VPQTGHTPFVAGLPFFNVTGCASLISCFALHFTQYASIGILLKNQYEHYSTIAKSSQICSNYQFFKKMFFYPLPQRVKLKDIFYKFF
jgi:hypothetical protein